LPVARRAAATFAALDLKVGVAGEAKTAADALMASCSARPEGKRRVASARSRRRRSRFRFLRARPGEAAGLRPAHLSSVQAAEPDRRARLVARVLH